MKIRKASTRLYVYIVNKQDLEVSDVQICMICNGESINRQRCCLCARSPPVCAPGCQKLMKHDTSMPEYAREEGVAHLKVSTTLSCEETWRPCYPGKYVQKEWYPRSLPGHSSFTSAPNADEVKGTRETDVIAALAALLLRRGLFRGHEG
jgi:hypothetical protein